jgi:pyruvate dehydrogenase E2 component (dihydrolipoamide acetyltransferase)
VPGLNGTWSPETGLRPSEAVNLGVAIALRGGGLVAPAIRGADDLDLAATMRAMRDLVTRARSGRLRSSEMTSATITLSGLGESGAEEMTGVIFPPQVALVGIGAPQHRPWVVGDAVEARRVLAVTLSADHRVGDGRLASDFLTRLEDLMQRPEAL